MTFNLHVQVKTLKKNSNFHNNSHFDNIDKFEPFIYTMSLRKSSKDYDVIVTSIYQLLYETRKISTSGVQHVALVINEVTVFIVHDA